MGNAESFEDNIDTKLNEEQCKQITKELKSLQADIKILNYCIQNPPKDCKIEHILTSKGHLNTLLNNEVKAIELLAKSGIIIPPILSTEFKEKQE